MMLGSFAASITIAGWDHRQSIHRTQLIEHVNAYDAPARDMLDKLTSFGMSTDSAYAQINRMVDSEAYMLDNQRRFLGDHGAVPCAHRGALDHQAAVRGISRRALKNLRGYLRTGRRGRAPDPRRAFPPPLSRRSGARSPAPA